MSPRSPRRASALVLGTISTIVVSLSIACLATPAARAGCGDQAIELLPSNGTGVGDGFANAVALDGNVALVSAQLLDGVYFYRYDGSAWREEQIVSAPLVTSVALKGDVALIGMGFSHTAQILRYDGATWSVEQTLQSSFGTHGEFGFSVALDQDVALIGAPLDSTPAGGHTGAAFFFRYDGTTWNEEAAFAGEQSSDVFGRSVALNGGLGIVGAYGLSGGYDHGGYARIYRFDGTQWVMEYRATSPDGPLYAFGEEVAISDNLALVSETRRKFDDYTMGCVHSFRYDTNTWVEEPFFNMDQVRWFIHKISLRGDRAIISAIDGGAGLPSAFIFEHRSGAWLYRSAVFADHPGFGSGVAQTDQFVIAGAYGKYPDPQYGFPGTPGAAYLWSVQDLGPAVLWENYGTGWPGQYGIPEFVADYGPYLVPGCDAYLYLSNSRRSTPTTALLFMGLDPADLPTPFGGHLLLLPRVVISISIPSSDMALGGFELPTTYEWAGLSIYLQIIEWDPAASQGYSFTPGLKLQWALPLGS